MKLASMMRTIAALVFFGGMIPAYGQHEGQDNKPGEKQEDKRGADKPQHEKGRGEAPKQQAQPQQQQAQEQRPDRQPAEQPRQQTAPRAQQPEPRVQPQQPQAQQEQQHVQQQARTQPQQQPQQQRARQQARTWQTQKGWLQHGSWQGGTSWQQNRAQNWSRDHRTWEQRGGYGGYYVPQEQFSMYFGRQHFFRLGSRPVMYLGYPLFEYGGFAFLMVDPWPEYWADDWYGSDDVYIDYNDGYYLCNRRYPDVRLAITITL